MKKVNWIIGLTVLVSSATSFAAVYNGNLKGTPRKIEAKKEIAQSLNDEAILVKNEVHPKKLPYLKKRISKKVAKKK